MPRQEKTNFSFFLFNISNDVLQLMQSTTQVILRVRMDPLIKINGFVAQIIQQQDFLYRAIFAAIVALGVG